MLDGSAQLKARFPSEKIELDKKTKDIYNA